MIFVDTEIKRLIGENKISVFSTRPDQPFEIEKQVGSASIDLRLSNHFIRFKTDLNEISFQEKNPVENFSVNDQDFLILNPNEVVQASTIEVVQLPGDIAAFVTGRSSVARLGLMIQATQDFIQPGSKALIPLQLINVTSKPMKIPPLFRICQIILFQTSGNTSKEYSSLPSAKYKDEVLVPQASKLHTEMENFANVAKIRQLLVDAFSESELRDLCFDIEIDYESLPGHVKTDKARELLAHVRRHGQGNKLLTECRKRRPMLDWFGQDSEG